MSGTWQPDAETAKRWLGQMLLIRRLEERCVELYQATKIRGFLHLYSGEEAVAVGVADALTPEDWVVSHYREHGHALVRGVSPRAIMAEMFGRLGGCSRGRGGSMHLFTRARRFVGGHAIVGGTLPVSVGLALGDKLQNRAAITASFFGDGAVAEGAFHESMNLASLWKLPLLFVCENNFYAMGTALDRYQAQPDLLLKAAGYAIPAERVDGMDVIAVAETVHRAAAAVRAGEGPRFVECVTYRFRAHSMFDAELYRDKAEVNRWKARDPIPRFVEEGKRRGLFDDAEVERQQAQAIRTVDDAIAWAEASPLEPVEDLTKFVYSPEPSP